MVRSQASHVSGLASICEQNWHLPHLWIICEQNPKDVLIGKSMINLLKVFTDRHMDSAWKVILISKLSIMHRNMWNQPHRFHEFSQSLPLKYLSPFFQDSGGSNDQLWCISCISLLLKLEILEVFPPNSQGNTLFYWPMNATWMPINVVLLHHGKEPAFVGTPVFKLACIVPCIPTTQGIEYQYVCH